MALEMKYFVLNPRSKKHEDIYALASRTAMTAYADVIKEEDAVLAVDLYDWAIKEAYNDEDMEDKEV